MHTDRQAGRQVGSQTDRQTDRHILGREVKDFSKGWEPKKGDYLKMGGINNFCELWENRVIILSRKQYRE